MADTDSDCHGITSPSVKFLFTSKTGSLGHLLPLLPIAEAACASGEEVAIATSVDRSHDVEAIGCEFLAAGLALSQVPGQIELVRQLLVESGRPPPPRWGWDLEHTYAEMFTTVHAPVMADDLTHVVETFRPDVLVCDVAEFAGPVAAAVAGIPCREPWARTADSRMVGKGGGTLGRTNVDRTRVDRAGRRGDVLRSPLLKLPVFARSRRRLAERDGPTRCSAAARITSSGVDGDPHREADGVCHVGHRCGTRGGSARRRAVRPHRPRCEPRSNRRT